MNIKKLGQRGFSHDILLIAMVAVAAIGGTGYIVMSKANSSKEVLGAAVSAPVNKKVTYCEIKNVPKKPRHEAVLNPTLVIHNKSKEIIQPKINTYLAVYLKEGQPPVVTAPAEPIAVNAIAAKGTSRNKIFPTLTVPYKSTEKGYRGVYIAESTTPKFSCSTSFTFPKQPKNSNRNTPVYGPTVVAPAQ